MLRSKVNTVWEIHIVKPEYDNKYDCREIMIV